MKTKIFTLACILTLVSGTAFAQEAPSPQDQASAATRDMSDKLGLNEGEYIRLRALNDEKFSREAEINKMYGNDIRMRENKLAELTNHYDKQLQSFLSAKQLEAYGAYKNATLPYTALKEDPIK